MTTGGSMDKESLEEYLHEHIPLSKAMQLSVIEANPNKVVLSAPLLPNINHIGTAFGGSESAAAILAAWSLLHVRLDSTGIPCTIIIQRHSIDYEQPVPKDFTAQAHLTKPEDWERFIRMFQTHGKARINISSIIECDSQQAASFEGDFIAINR